MKKSESMRGAVQKHRIVDSRSTVNRNSHCYSFNRSNSFHPAMQYCANNSNNRRDVFAGSERLDSVDRDKKIVFFILPDHLFQDLCQCIYIITCVVRAALTLRECRQTVGLKTR